MARPIRTIAVSFRYVRSFRSLSADLQERLVVRERIFRSDAFDSRLGTHKLKGQLEGLWSYLIDRSFRVLFEFSAADAVLYHDVGSHRIYR